MNFFKVIFFVMANMICLEQFLAANTEHSYQIQADQNIQIQLIIQYPDLCMFHNPSCDVLEQDAFERPIFIVMKTENNAFVGELPKLVPNNYYLTLDEKTSILSIKMNSTVSESQFTQLRCIECNDDYNKRLRDFIETCCTIPVEF